MKPKEEPKYFDFNAHFKYNELVEALNKLKSSKNESTSNTSNANINNNNNIISKENSNCENNNQNNILKDNEHMNKNTNNKQNKSKPRNHKGVSRNIQMNNYIKYVGYIEECKDNNISLTNVSNNYQPNKTSYIPQKELVKERMNDHLKEINHLKQKILLDKIPKEMKNEQYDVNINDNLTKNNNHDFNNLISTSLISNSKKKNVISNKDNQNVSKNEKNSNPNCQNNKKKTKKKMPQFK